jgi:hypothetical protein
MALKFERLSQFDGKTSHWDEKAGGTPFRIVPEAGAAQI